MTPYELFAAAEVPSTVELWPLSASPQAPVSLADVRLLREDRVRVVKLQWLPPAPVIDGAMVCRQFDAQLVLKNGQEGEVPVLAVALVDAAGDGRLIGTFPVAGMSRVPKPPMQWSLHGNAIAGSGGG
jgi:hypothetical protein